MSEKDPIEELFRENQHGLDEKPRDLIWDRIEERLDEKSVVKKKPNFWKYGAAASVVVGLTIGIWAILNNQNQVKSEMAVPQMVLEESVEINEENASEILDRLEENQDAIVLHETKEALPEAEMEAPKIRQTKPEPTVEKESNLEDRLETYAEKTAPAIVSAAPAMESPKKAKESEAIVFRGETPEQKEGNYVLRNKSEISDYELDESRRLGNSAFGTTDSPHQMLTHQISIPVKNVWIKYDVISLNDSLIVFENQNVAYPTQIKFQSKKDSVQVIYSGKNSKKNSTESKIIQKFVNQNKLNLRSQIIE
ncbi:hypothetical protein [Moheibacter lacus]|uniref:Uncharacterized protein n=1 Tax=Moheibacter lacus TaxID=2745851 RepID=A0A838ZPL5_9FLAO|nr:hypothetical protein [Moheibacter lacus]MBA5628795.1 hypothetical protein [Moheibacter lacus]